MKASRSSFVVLALGLCLALPSAAPAQSQVAGGAIEGTISDQSGAVVSGANVTVRNVATGVTRQTTTDSSGYYRAPLLPVGNYEVSASAAGFALTRRTDLPLTVGQSLVVDIQLTVAGKEEEVTVSAESPVIEATRTHQAATVNSTAVSNLPVNGRNFIDFVLTTPGVTRDVRTGDISFAGQRGTLNSLVVDGADSNNTFFGQTLGRAGSGRSPYQFSQESVQEFQVNSNAYTAEYGRAGGAVINVVTKSGTNAFHGSAFEYYRDKSLNANSWANKTASPQRERSEFHVDQFGASIGGPIVKDKAFFFASYDGQRQTLPNDINLEQNLAGITLPTDPDTIEGLAKLESKADSWEQSLDQDVFLARVDFQATPAHRFTLRYNHQNFTGGGFERSGPTNAEEHSGDSLVRTRTLNLQVASVLGPSLFNELRVAYVNDNEPGTAYIDTPEATVREQGRTILTIGRNFFSPRETTIDRWQFADTVTWIRGVHALKFGVDFVFDQILNFFPGNFSGSYTFNSIASFNRGTPNGSGESYVQAFPGAGTTGAETNPDIFEFAGFVQDEWKIQRNLTLTLGLRYDLQLPEQPTVQNPDPQLLAAGIDTSVINEDKNNFSPRIGLAWSPNPRLVVRAGYGLFYGRTPSIMTGTAHSNNGINVGTGTFRAPGPLPTYPQKFGELPPGTTLPRPTIFVFDSGYVNPEVHQASAGFEYALSDDLAVAANYLFVAGRKLQRSTDINIGPAISTPVPVQGGGTVTIDRYPGRPFTNFGRIIAFQSTAESTYNGVTVELRRRFRGGLQAGLAYTLGKVEDTRPDATAVVPNSFDDAKFASNPGDFEADRAPGDNDERHRLVFSGYWDVGFWKDGEGAKKALLDGWYLSWIYTLASGKPYSGAITNDANADGNTRNDIVPGMRDSENLPTFSSLDARLGKRIPLGGTVRLELIAEGFNLFNRTNISAQRTGFYNFSGGVLIPQANFGQDSGAFDPRIIQLAAKLTF